VSHFFAMGGYARYLWPSYGVTLLAVLLNIIWARGLLRRAKSDARRRQAIQGEAR
jgi:heme exporter protein CcmD